MMDRSNSNVCRRPLRTGNAWLVMLVILVAMAGTLAFLWSQKTSPTVANAQVDTEATPGTRSEKTPASPGSAAPKTKAAAPTPIVQGWPQPAFVLAITGQQHGYIEPCGCSPKQSGGLARRADLFRQLREEKKWPVMGLETGGTLEGLRVTRRQSLLKFNMNLDALNNMGYRVLGLGTEELKLGANKLFEIYSERNVQEGFDLPFVAANVVLHGSPELGTPLAYRLLEIGGKQVAVTSVFGNEFKPEFALINEDEIKIVDPAVALPKVLATMKAEKPDVLVVLSYDSVEASKAIAHKFPELDVVVSAAGADDPGNDFEMIGKTLFFVSGMKGKHVNVVGFYPGEKVAVRFERVELDQDRFGRAPKMRELMAKYQELLKEEWLDPSSETRMRAPDHPSEHQFMGAKSCAECHASAYEVWEGSNHAHATASLLDGRPEEKGTWIDRTYDPECLACHATGWDAQEALPYRDGFIDALTTPHLAGNQCENCHGPGSEHVKLETDWKKLGGDITEALTASRRAVRVTQAQAEKKVCLKCHDFANSPNFDFNEYWPQIEHPTPAAEKARPKK